jgi:flagellar biosynthesis/type III secretory pathway protein FliH
MCLTEYDEQKNLLWFKEDGYKEGYKEGKEEGRKEGEIRFGKLIDKMVAAGRIDDMTRVATDSEYRHQLYKEFHITD